MNSSTNDCDINYQMNNSHKSNTSEVEHNTSEVNDNLPNQLRPSTLVLQFNHSANPCTATISNDETINSPLDIYRRFGEITFLFVFRCHKLKFLNYIDLKIKKKILD